MSDAAAWWLGALLGTGVFVGLMLLIAPFWQETKEQQRYLRRLSRVGAWMVPGCLGTLLLLALSGCATVNPWEPYAVPVVSFYSLWF